MMVILNFHCGDITREKTTEKKISPEEKIKFHSPENPGKWKNQSSSHTPAYHVEKTGDSYNVTVSVPLKGSTIPLHYIEVILIADSRHRELKKKTFTRGVRNAKALFTLPADTQSPVYAVIKCNLHDMWEKKIDLEKSQ